MTKSYTCTCLFCQSKKTDENFTAALGGIPHKKDCSYLKGMIPLQYDTQINEVET